MKLLRMDLSLAQLLLYSTIVAIFIGCVSSESRPSPMVWCISITIFGLAPVILQALLLVIKLLYALFQDGRAILAPNPTRMVGLVTQNTIRKFVPIHLALLALGSLPQFRTQSPYRVYTNLNFISKEKKLIHIYMPDPLREFGGSLVPPDPPRSPYCPRCDELEELRAGLICCVVKGCPLAEEARRERAEDQLSASMFWAF